MVTFHSTTDIDDQPKRKLSILLPALSRCHRLLVHSINDLNRLKELGLVENVMLFPHGVVNYHSNGKPPATDKIVIASYGFFLPHKGLLELIDAFALLVKKNMNIKLLMLNAEYPINVSARLISQAKAKISKLGISNHVELMNDYLPDKESLDLMANANLIVFPYQNSGESTSASVRYGLATGCPIAVTPLPIFDDVASAVYHLPGCSPAEICEGISQILDEINHNTDKAQKTEEMADQWRNTHYYSYLADRLYRVTIALNRKYL
jgi:glycosyltransferase involved in cell wall biosynthesis